MKNTTTTTENEVVFDITKALIIIEKDADLNDMFSAKFGNDFKLIHASINAGNSVTADCEAYTKGLFNLIVEKTALRNKYLSLDNEVVAEPVAEVVEVVEVKEEAPTKKVANKMRWGLRAIASDIADNFKGKSTQLHRTAKLVQELKKLYIRLEQKTWKERFKEETLTDEQLRELSGAIETFNKKVESIVNPKK